MNQVHKENLTTVENALPNRQGLDVEIFGMEGVPEDIVQQHNQRIIQNFYTAQAERYAATGNPPAGQSGNQGPRKKLKAETAEELKARLAQHRARIATQNTTGAGGVPGAAPGDGNSPAQGVSACIIQMRANLRTRMLTLCSQNSPFPFPPPSGAPGAPGYPQAQTYPFAHPPGPSPPPGAPGAFNLPPRPPSGTPQATTLPQRPPYGGFYNGGASTVDELVSGASRPADDIDQIIRMAEAGIKPPRAGGDEATVGEKKGKKDKDKNTRMVYADLETSPEERLAMMPRYAFDPEIEV